MTCAEYQELLLDSLTESVGADRQAAAAAHLAECPACAAWAAGMRRLWEELGRLPAPSAPEMVMPRIPAGTRLRSRRRQLLLGLGYAASLLLVFWTGRTMNATANSTTPSGAPATPTWLLLLREPTGALLVESGSPEERAVEQEYSAWAGGLAGQGLLVGGEKLADPITVLPTPGAAEATTITGFFLIRAPTLEEAERIATGSPHIRRGGTIELRRIDPT